MANTYTLIASNTLTSSAASVTFSSIPATYTDLVLRASVRSDRAGQTYDVMNVQPNGNSTSTNYSFTYLYGQGTSAGSYNVTTSSGYTSWSNFGIPGASATSNTFSNSELYIPNYAGSNKKVGSGISMQENNSSTANSIDVTAQLYQDTTAISSLVILAAGTRNFVSGSSFFLYGIKSN